jgi:AraC-like DNA-binding protein
LFAEFTSFEEPLRFAPGREGFLSVSRQGQHPPHRHREREFNLVTAGRSRYLLWGETGLRRVELSAGTLIWLYPHQDHVLIDKTPDYRAWIGVATDALLTPFVDPQPGADDARLLAPTDLTSLDTLCAEVQGVSEAGRFNAGLAWVFVRARQAFESAAALSSPAALHPAVARAVRQLRDQPQKDYSVETLAALCGLSGPHLSRLFRLQTGLSLTAFRNRERVRRFDTLRSTDPQATLLQIALEAGFGSYSQLHRCYVATYGAGPRQRAREVTLP